MSAFEIVILLITFIIGFVIVGIWYSIVTAMIIELLLHWDRKRYLKEREKENNASKRGKSL